ncbi:hypothetical protein K443DRAFT_10693 [Laccaria amethystina LaAM-08-1]|uniref:Uncharacterized protein n=1 Tax=Laccaria amethystina LaAM-08-1 TaxID=1095629 RepID=A0A0C9WV90_9AGAR|nr:hypothetical protein K443DRAFT_10693 [Laccaria amethystina LaAM-08-1]
MCHVVQTVTTRIVIIVSRGPHRGWQRGNYQTHTERRRDNNNDTRRQTRVT